MSKQTIIPPDLDDLLEELKNSIFAKMNCIQIGKIETVNLEEQTAEIKIQVKRRVQGSKTVDYPLLVDCPIVVMQGGGAFLEFPVKPGDYCLTFFNDRDIDTWWSTANVSEPPTKRKHSLSDGFALVGINPKTSVLDLSGDKVVLNATGYPLEIKTDKSSVIESNGSIIDGGSGDVDIVTGVATNLNPAARKEDLTIIDGVTDAAFIAWIANVSSVLNGLVPGSVPSIPVTASGKINSGSLGVNIG